MVQTIQFDLIADRKGVIWDLMLYIPTVVALGSIAASFWYSQDQNMAYVFLFLTTFFLIAGVNRVFKTRLMLFPSSLTTMTLAEQSINLMQRNGQPISLVKGQKFYSDYAGKSFGISGIDGSGKQLQFVFLKGQFMSPEKFEAAKEALRNRYK